MKKYSVAYCNQFDGYAKTHVIEADNENEAIVIAVLQNQDDINTRDWLELIKHNSLEEFKNELVQGDIFADVKEIIN